METGVYFRSMVVARDETMAEAENRVKGKLLRLVIASTDEFPTEFPFLV